MTPARAFVPTAAENKRRALETELGKPSPEAKRNTLKKTMVNMSAKRLQLSLDHKVCELPFPFADVRL